ncbi:MAG: hypothetical protein PHE70_01700 [Tepidanaerobacteraceae bacterium]|nr:hypothetical protein [Tepidanaerobacteraceae bacterium]
MDDYSDQNIDILIGKPNLSIVMELGGLPYALLLFLLSFLLDASTSIGLFLASFALGMAGSLNVKMPSGLYGYQESIITVLFGFLVLGRVNMTSSMLIIATIQLWDDLIDYKKDGINKKNWAFIIGKVEALLLAIIFFLLTLYLDCVKAISTIIFMHIIVYMINLLFKTPQKILDIEGKL